MQYLEKVITEFEKLLQEFGGEVRPCTQEEVEELESLLPNSYCLPAAYKEFLFYGGKKMGDIFSEGCFFEYEIALAELKSRNRDTISTLKMYEPEAQIPPDFFLIGDHHGSYFEYVLLTEGDNPPVYAWNEEQEGGLETAQKKFASFSDFLINEIRFNRMHLASKAISKKLEAGQPPRGQQIWYPTHQEQNQGVSVSNLVGYFGFSVLGSIQKATTLSGLNTVIDYLEELSGWQASSSRRRNAIFSAKSLN
jgi:hypothetical protein